MPDSPDPASSPNQVPPDETAGEPSDGSLSEARLADVESVVDENASGSISESPSRDLSSVATLATCAPEGEGPDYPPEYAHPLEIAQCPN